MLSASARPTVTVADITVFLAPKLGVPVARIEADSDICDDLGCDGDDFGEMMRDFATKFQVNLNGYQWHFHSGPEGSSLFALFGLFSRSVPHIPVTPLILADAANSGRWMLAYPEVDDVRDLRLQTFLTAFVIVAIVVFAITASISFLK